jgi:hypothetical protein
MLLGSNKLDFEFLFLSESAFDTFDFTSVPYLTPATDPTLLESDPTQFWPSLHRFVFEHVVTVQHCFTMVMLPAKYHNPAGRSVALDFSVRLSSKSTISQILFPCRTPIDLGHLLIARLSNNSTNLDVLSFVDAIPALGFSECFPSSFTSKL